MEQEKNSIIALLVVVLIVVVIIFIIDKLPKIVDTISGWWGRAYEYQILSSLESGTNEHENSDTPNIFLVDMTSITMSHIDIEDYVEIMEYIKKKPTELAFFFETGDTITIDNLDMKMHSKKPIAKLLNECLLQSSVKGRKALLRGNYENTVTPCNGIKEKYEAECKEPSNIIIITGLPTLASDVSINEFSLGSETWNNNYTIMRMDDSENRFGKTDKYVFTNVLSMKNLNMVTIHSV